jgi:hypothetical protein
MPITSSQIISQTPQKVGTLVTERHVASTGEAFDIDYVALDNTDTTATLVSRAAQLDAMLVEQELARLLDGA